MKIETKLSAQLALSALIRTCARSERAFAACLSSALSGFEYERWYPELTPQDVASWARLMPRRRAALIQQADRQAELKNSSSLEALDLSG